jgi:hypothetical protein
MNPRCSCCILSFFTKVMASVEKRLAQGDRGSQGDSCRHSEVWIRICRVKVGGRDTGSATPHLPAWGEGRGEPGGVA